MNYPLTRAAIAAYDAFRANPNPWPNEYENPRYKLDELAGKIREAFRAESNRTVSSTNEIRCIVGAFAAESADESVEREVNRLVRSDEEWPRRIHDALDQGRFCLYSQGIVVIQDSSQRDVHSELLVRMIDEKGGLIAPMAFIPAAEQFSLMSFIDRWVVKEAFSILGHRQSEKDGQSPSVSINLSGETLGEEHFLDFVREQFTNFKVKPTVVCFEITERVPIANLGLAARFITELKGLGCRFTLDNFGHGMSSLAYLKHLPVDFMKMAGSYVKDVLDDPIDRAVVESMNHIGHVMGKRTIATHVENDEILASLRDIGVDFAQGYGIAKPVPFVPANP